MDILDVAAMNVLLANACEDGRQVSGTVTITSNVVNDFRQTKRYKKKNKKRQEKRKEEGEEKRSEKRNSCV